MPTYGYQCTQCDNEFEIVQRITDDPLTKCDSCGGELKKKIFPVGIAFKGSGFYVNDYASKSAAKSETASESKPATSASSESKTSDPKPVESSTTAGTPAAQTSASTPAPSVKS